MFTISKKSTNQQGQVLLIVLKDGKLDRGDNAYVQQQVPEDFADYLISLQKGRNTVLEEAAVLCEEKERGCGKTGCECWKGGHLAMAIRLLKQG